MGTRVSFWERTSCNITAGHCQALETIMFSGAAIPAPLQKNIQGDENAQKDYSMWVGDMLSAVFTFGILEQTSSVVTGILLGTILLHRYFER